MTADRTDIAAEPWWKRAVVYQIYPRSFCDTSGNGVGDLEGVRRHLDHLVWLGVDALWLSPIFRSPMVDHGYDVADYCDIDPLFGSLHDIDRLIEDAHQRDLKVLLDWVPNHSSDQHPWFLESRSSRDNPRRDWYVWVDGEPDTPPNDWQAAFPEGPAWTWDDATEAWYLHRFTPQQPDLNWEHPGVQEAMHDTLRFWLDRGVDGFRMDVIHMIGKRRGRITDGSETSDDPEFTHELLARIRQVVDGYEGDRVAVGEVYILDPERVATYVGDDKLHLAFNFVPQWTPWTAKDWAEQIAIAEGAFGRGGGWPTWVLNNHDIMRFRSRVKGDEQAARAAAVLLLTLRGTPFLYQGEELGLEDPAVPEEMRQDPAGRRDGCRAPVPWDPSPSHGWVRSDNWLPWPPDAERRNAETMAADESSILHLYRGLLSARRGSDALTSGSLELLRCTEDVVAFERAAGADRRTVLVNFARDEAAYDLDGDWMVEVASDGRAEGDRYDGVVRSRQALVLRPG